MVVAAFARAAVVAAVAAIAVLAAMVVAARAMAAPATFTPATFATFAAVGLGEGKSDMAGRQGQRQGGKPERQGGQRRRLAQSAQAAPTELLRLCTGCCDEGKLVAREQRHRLILRDWNRANSPLVTERT
jgi:hypothetical protein